LAIILIINNTYERGKETMTQEEIKKLIKSEITDNLNVAVTIEGSDVIVEVFYDGQLIASATDHMNMPKIRFE
jgi:hypothetical protein